MMSGDERKLATSALIPLEVDPASILSLSKGVIFDTIVHNIEYTFNNRCTDSLPWKLIGMSLICDANRNKKYLQKLQKMQCVPSVISTQIYHSKLIKTESGKLTTPGRKIVIPTNPKKRLTGIIVCRSIDELLFLEAPNAKTVHFIQYKLLSYERIATRELVNGPKLSSVGDKIIKTVFDFELTQNNGFPRQLLPFAIISFAKQDGCDLCSSIRNFLKLDEHKTFDKTYLVTTTNSELTRLREEQERKEDAEAEQETPWEKIQRRQPLADLSKKTTDTGNARPSPIPQSSLRVPPLKIKLSGHEKSSKQTVSATSAVSLPPLESKFRCLLKLDKVDLFSYDISNLANMPQAKDRKPNDSSTSSNLVTNKTKPVNISKPHEHHKPLKRLNNSIPKKQISHSSEIAKEKGDNKPNVMRVPPNSSMASLNKDKIDRRPSSNSSTSIEKPAVQKTIVKKKVQRPILPPEYKCELSLPQIDLSMYNIDLPPIYISNNPVPMDTESTSTTSPFTSTSAETMDLPIEQESSSDTIQPMFTLEKENICENDQNMIAAVQHLIDFDIHETLTMNNNLILSSPINETVSKTNDEYVLPIFKDISPVPSHADASQTTNEALPQATNEMMSQTNAEYLSFVYEAISPAISPEDQPQATNVVSSKASGDNIVSVTNEVKQAIQNEGNMETISPNKSATVSSALPQANDDSVVFSLDNFRTPRNDMIDTIPQDYIIIVPCSDDDDDFDDDEIDSDTAKLIRNGAYNKIIESSPSSAKTLTSPILSNPSFTRILADTCSLDSHRLSTSSCSSLSASILHNQSPRSALNLTEVSVSQKILNKQQKSVQAVNFNRYNINIPLFANEPLIDPRLIYRLQAITTDLRWQSTCAQCSTSSESPISFHSSTQLISYDQRYSSGFVDPRRESLKQAILNVIYIRLKILMPHLLIHNSNQFENLLFEQTAFKTNCSIHLEYLLNRIKGMDETNFIQMIKSQEEFQLSSSLLQLIFI
ncbi:unnamed protein product [Rotaria magnacalcarata]